MEIIGSVLAEKAVEASLNDCVGIINILFVIAVLGWVADKLHKGYLWIKHKVFKIPEPKKSIVDKFWEWFGF